MNGLRINLTLMNMVRAGTFAALTCDLVKILSKKKKGETKKKNNLVKIFISLVGISTIL